MGYDANETPEISTILYYYDKGKCGSEDFCEKLLRILRKYRFDDANKIILGKHVLVEGLKEDRTCVLNSESLAKMDWTEKFSGWVNDEQVDYIEFQKVKNRGCLVWDVTWFKMFGIADGVQPNGFGFNHFSVNCIYDMFESQDSQNSFVDFFCELCELFGAFYGVIEDIATSVDLFEMTREKTFNYRRIQTVHWGNYLGEQYREKAGDNKLAKLKFDVKKFMDKGVYLGLTDNLFDSRDNPDFGRRKRLYWSLRM